MNFYKILFLLIIILIVLSYIITYIKINILYHPLPAIKEKYERFYQKLFQLAESKNNITNIFIKTSDGELIDTIYIKNPDTKKCIIYFHGNAGNIAMRFDMIKFLYNFASVVIFDYRSYGRSSGNKNNLSLKLLQRDAIAVWNYCINNLNIEPNNISFFGESLGCSVAISIAEDLSKRMDSYYYPHSLICNSPFYSLESMIKYNLNKINVGFITKILVLISGNEYRSDEMIKFINHRTKIIIAHSPRDEVIPYNEGWRLYKSISQNHPNSQFINITGTHNNFGLTDQYIYALADVFND